jgi:DNA-binding XRE family transcriptional regulator
MEPGRMTIASFPSQVRRITLGSLIRAERESHPGHTQDYCAAAIGFTRRQWINWEGNYCHPSGEAMRAIAKLYPNLMVKLLSLDFT